MIYESVQNNDGLWRISEISTITHETKIVIFIKSGIITCLGCTRRKTPQTFQKIFRMETSKVGGQERDGLMMSRRI